MSTPRTDALCAELRDRIHLRGEQIMIAHARALETELARCREALARALDGDWLTGGFNDDTCAALRDLSKPVPEVLP